MAKLKKKAQPKSVNKSAKEKVKQVVAKTSAKPAKVAAKPAKAVAKPILKKAKLVKKTEKPAEKAKVVAKASKPVEKAKKATVVDAKKKIDKPAKVAAPVKEAAPKKIVGKKETAKKDSKKDADENVIEAKATGKRGRPAAKTDEDDGKDLVSEDAGDEWGGEAPAQVETRKAKNAEAETGDADEVVLTDAEGRRYCKVKECDQVSSVELYCRFHYLMFWKKIQQRKKILSEGQLGKYIEELTSRYPDKFLEIIRKDLRTQKDFLAAIAELEIDEGTAEGEFEDETQSYLEEVRGVSSETAVVRDEEEF